MNVSSVESFYDVKGMRHFVNKSTGKVEYILNPQTGDIYDEQGKWLERDIDFLH